MHNTELIDRLMAAAHERTRYDDTTELLVEAARALAVADMRDIGPPREPTLVDAMAAAGGDPAWPDWRPE